MMCVCLMCLEQFTPEKDSNGNELNLNYCKRCLETEE